MSDLIADLRTDYPPWMEDEQPDEVIATYKAERVRAAAALAAANTELNRLREHIASLDHIPLRYKDRPPLFVETRRKICSTPDLCFEFGDTAPVCGPCDSAVVRLLYQKKETGDE